MDTIRLTKVVVEEGYPDPAEHLVAQKLSLDFVLIFLAVQEL